MSEKKEYIGIFKTSDVKINGKDYIAKIPAGGSELYTRDEAVERIAKAIFKKDNVLALSINFEQLKESQRKFYLNLAEAALDALLGK